MNLVWAVIKGDLATSGFWFLVYALVALGQAWWQRRRRAAAGALRVPRGHAG